MLLSSVPYLAVGLIVQWDYAQWAFVLLVGFCPFPIKNNAKTL